MNPVLKDHKRKQEGGTQVLLTQVSGSRWLSELKAVIEEKVDFNFVSLREFQGN